MMLADTVRERLAEWLAKPGDDRNAQLDVSLRLLCKWRSALIQNTVQQHNGTRIWSGPFEGVDFLPRSTHGCHVSKLVGCYEQPLQPFIEEAIRLLATWEWRSGPTPWLVMRSRREPGQPGTAVQAPGAAPPGPERE